MFGHRRLSVFGWFKRKPQPAQPDARVARFKHHFATANGSDSQCGCIAVAMIAIEEEWVQKVRDKLSGEAKVIFMMTYECFVMWAMRRGLESVLKPVEVEAIIAAIRSHFATHGFYRPQAFDKIWDKMQGVMPIAMTPTPDGMILPAAEMFMAPNMAGYPLDPNILVENFEFGLLVGLVLDNLARDARAMVMPSQPP
jgi:hypothetical protein